MTRREFSALKDGEVIWFKPPYFAYAMCGVKRQMMRKSGVWVNFFGDGQCFFAPRAYNRDRFCEWVSAGKEDASDGGL